MADITKDIQMFIDKLPECVGVVGYGSGVKKQKGYKSTDRRQIDLFIVVDDLKKWHNENMKRNPNQYAWMSKVFFKYFSEKAQHFGTDICYIPFIKDGKHEFKIGIIEEKDLLKDLIEWKTFYLAGRFQKDILILKSNQEMMDAIMLNRHNALVTSLLLLDPKDATFTDLMIQLCSLSYMGDTRMKFAENPDKVKNIVAGSMDCFKEIYCDDTYYQMDEKERITVDQKALFEKGVETLPTDLMKVIKPFLVDEMDAMSKEELLRLKSAITDYFVSLNQQSSLAQTLKGILTAGPVKSISYGVEKLKKARK